MISVIINCDTRPTKGDVGQMFDGTRSLDYLVDGLINKINFFSGLECEFILFVDEHDPVPLEVLEQIRPMLSQLILCKHSRHYKGAEPFHPFNDINYLHALSLARGEFIAHFDQDVATYTRGVDWVQEWMNYMGTYQFVSYPCQHSPNPTDDPTFCGHKWASTRAFFCRKDSINITELEQAIWNPETLYAKYSHPARINNWMEHFLGISCGYSVFYPPLSQDYLIFPWHAYKQGVLSKLNSSTYDQIAGRLVAAGAHSYHGVDAYQLSL